MMTLKIIAALAENGVIGRGGQLPWRLPRDFEWFRQHTGRSPVVMGRKTFLSLPDKSRPLPGRENIVLTRYPEGLSVSGVTVTSDFDHVVTRSKEEDIWVIGGAEIYSLALPHAQELFLTRVHKKIEGDTSFPEWDRDNWSRVFREKHQSDERHEFSFTFEIYQRRTARFIEMANCRTDKQRREMQAILETGKCPFCSSELKRWHDNPILREGRFWLVSRNDYPYPGSQNHFILISREHVEKLSDLTPGAASELFHFLAWLEEEFDLSGCGFYMRSGELLWTGGTIRHIHAHLVERAGVKSDPIMFYL